MKTMKFKQIEARGGDLADNFLFGLTMEGDVYVFHVYDERIPQFGTWKKVEDLTFDEVQAKADEAYENGEKL